ncbi:MAG: hypothetical protein ACQESR_30805 [Planctomycetota bacterium]
MGFVRLERCPTQAVLPWVGLAVNKLIRDRYMARLSDSYFLTDPYYVLVRESLKVAFYRQRLERVTLPTQSSSEKSCNSRSLRFAVVSLSANSVSAW